MSLLKKAASDILPLLAGSRGLSLKWVHVGRGFVVPQGAKLATVVSEDGVAFPLIARHNLRVLGSPFDAIVRKGIASTPGPRSAIKFGEGEVLFELQRMPRDCMQDAMEARLSRLRKAAENAVTRHLQFSRGICAYDLTLLMSKLREGVFEPDALTNASDLESLLAARLGASDEELLKRVVRSLTGESSRLLASRAPCV